jgi:hypothetical protein
LGIIICWQRKKYAFKNNKVFFSGGMRLTVKMKAAVKRSWLNG